MLLREQNPIMWALIQSSKSLLVIHQVKINNNTKSKRVKRNGCLKKRNKPAQDFEDQQLQTLPQLKQTFLKALKVLNLLILTIHLPTKQKKGQLKCTKRTEGEQ